MGAESTLPPSFPVPPGARLLPASPGPVLSRLGTFARAPGQPPVGQVDQYRWIAAGQPLAVLNWTRQRLTRHYAYGGRGSSMGTWSDDYARDQPRGVTTGQDLLVAVAAAVSPGRTGIGVAALVAYQLPAS